MPPAADRRGLAPLTTATITPSSMREVSRRDAAAVDDSLHAVTPHGTSARVEGQGVGHMQPRVAAVAEGRAALAAKDEGGSIAVRASGAGRVVPIVNAVAVGVASSSSSYHPSSSRSGGCGAETGSHIGVDGGGRFGSSSVVFELSLPLALSMLEHTGEGERRGEEGSISDVDSDEGSFDNRPLVITIVSISVH
eukprot:CAMPEP_0113532662 /NCGR_PEP_ID=MMETSP0015_2-20120614/4184_1 /TAXON_ID=2838 /ORGANISM="Odontella" /LENGTH=193 /DNA_ID=CAMNT_0000431649 /DNA_START=1331 /DNA_END=1913 /DNA_ORIENTATION=- /assembly_acc=CAM_ASM_000160